MREFFFVVFFLLEYAGNRYKVALSVDKQDLIIAYSVVKKHGAKCQRNYVYFLFPVCSDVENNPNLDYVRVDHRHMIECICVCMHVIFSSINARLSACFDG